MRSLHMLKLDAPPRDTMRAIRKLGVGVSFDAATDSYQLAWLDAGNLQTYATCDAQDALNTARALTVHKHNAPLMAAMLAGR